MRQINGYQIIFLNISGEDLHLGIHTRGLMIRGIKRGFYHYTEPITQVETNSRHLHHSMPHSEWCLRWWDRINNSLRLSGLSFKVWIIELKYWLAQLRILRKAVPDLNFSSAMNWFDDSPLFVHKRNKRYPLKLHGFSNTQQKTLPNLIKIILTTKEKCMWIFSFLSLKKGFLIIKGSLSNQSHFSDTIKHLLTDTQFSQPNIVQVLYEGQWPFTILWINFILEDGIWETLPNMPLSQSSWR